jgi:type I restriction-modification system DNA methylase subunit
MTAPRIINELIERFDRNADDYRFGTYNETQLRRDFVDPFFEALGWDVNNKLGYAEAYRHVIHEDAIKIGGQTKAPDYGFYIGETRKFFVEAKRPSVNIKLDPAAAFQLRRYGWSAKLPLSILTNFDEFAVYDCRSLKPINTDKPATARLMYLGYQEYAERWDEIAAIFSRDAVLKGAFDRYAEQTKGRRGTVEVDDAFLAEIESWRKALASNIYKNNPHLSTRELNFAVGSTIDRIIFLRICEDRGIEPEEQLKKLIEGKNVYQQLLGIFYRADQKYNSGLFHFDPEKGRAESPDTLTPSLVIDDKVLRDIFKNIYLPLSPYEFSVLPADILGQVYEQFLGKVIEVKGHRAEVQDKPEVRKEGGVYYTPTYIVDYIVKNTVGKLCEGKTVKQVDRLRILDPACGSGSFLIGAYQYLLDWYLEWYKRDGTEKHLKQLRQDARGQWRLATAERKRILLQNIYGVDIDTQAVEVTKLSLLLKVLEGESEQSLSRQMRLVHERVLPDLGSNIKWGNSLIDEDFYAEAEANQLSDEEIYRINPFSWSKGFPEIIKAGGFDAVIGNPPYRRELDYKHLMDEIATTSFGRRFRAPRMDLWYYFVHRGLELLKLSGVLSYITNAYWTAGTGAEKLIAALRDEAHVDEIFYLKNLKVFRGVSGKHMVMLISKPPSVQATTIKLVEPESETTAEPFFISNAPLKTFTKSREQLFRGQKVDLEVPSDELLAKLNGCTPLERLGNIRQGIAENPASINRKTNTKYGNRWETGCGVFTLSPEEVAQLSLTISEKKLLRPYHDLRDIGRYWIASTPSLFLIYSTRNTCPDINIYPHLRAHLLRFKPVMEARRETLNGSNAWWHLHWPRDENIWLSPKIISVQMAARPTFALAEYPVYVSFSANVFVAFETTAEKLHYITGILNSRLIWKWYQHHAKRRGVGLEINGGVLAKSPIRTIDFSDPTDKARHDRMVEMVKKMLAMHEQLAAARTEQERTMIQRRIEATDAQIDKLVYELYGLTEEEVRVVEEASR